MIDISAEHLRHLSEVTLMVQDGVVCYCNEAAEILFRDGCIGKRPEELLGENCPPPDAQCYVGELELPEGQFMLRACTADGVTSLFLTKLGTPPEIVNDAMLFGLRNRLTSIMEQLSPLRERAEDKRDEITLQGLAQISEYSLGIRRGIDNLTLAHQLQAGRLDCRFVRFDICLMLHELADTVNLLRRGEPKLTVLATKPELIEADYEKVEQLLLNLISNALRHAKGAKNITLNVVSSGANVIVSVDDDGCGISEEAMARTFNRFLYRFKLKDPDEGAGLGLTVVRGIAQAHGGTLLMESSPDGGTRVRVSLRRRQTEKRPSGAEKALTEKRMDRLLAGLTGCLEPDCYREQFFD